LISDLKICGILLDSESAVYTIVQFRAAVEKMMGADAPDVIMASIKKDLMPKL